MSRWTRALERASMFVLVAIALASGSWTLSARSDSLSSWNNGAAKQSIVDFVGRVTKIGGADFVPEARRVAVFDNDGTLWAEQPIALRKGARFSSLPLARVMAFIDTSETIVAAEIAQIYARYIEPDQKVEVTFKFLPGQIFTGHVETVLQAVSTGQVQPSGLAVTPKQIEAERFVVRIKLDDADVLKHLPAGSTGEAAIFTSHVTASHIVRRVMLRMTAILNYVNPF